MLAPETWTGGSPAVEGVAAVNKRTLLEKTPLFAVLLLTLLMVIFGWVAVIGPARNHGRGHSRMRAKTEVVQLTTAIRDFENFYGYLPISTNVAASGTPDFTFGTVGTDAQPEITNATGYQANNSEVISILCDLTHFGNGQSTPNALQSRNPKRIVFLNVHRTESTNSPGLGPDGVFRDPYGNPYIITLDLNRDDRCRDAFYRLARVSAAGAETNGFSPPNPPPRSSAEARDSYEAKTGVMVWSFGPDHLIDPARDANDPPNKDNIISWK
jgi:hypothetical protein